jgi:hypothetical protein
MSSINERKLKEWVERLREAREVRRRFANWEFIKSQPPKLRVALEYFVETGDFRTAASLAGMGVDEFVDLARFEAGIPLVY